LCFSVWKKIVWNLFQCLIFVNLCFVFVSYVSGDLEKKYCDVR
jgi:hypothetical protein